MTDNERRVEIQKLLPDNTTGEISALDLRNIIIMLSQDMQVSDDNIKVGENRFLGLGLTTGNNNKNIMVTTELMLDKPQTLPSDPAVIAKDHRYLTVANGYAIEVSLKQYADATYSKTADVAQAIADINDNFIKKTNNLTIGNRSGSAQITIDAKADTATQLVLERAGVKHGHIGYITAGNKMEIYQEKQGDIEFILPAGQSITSKIGGVFKTLAFAEDIAKDYIPMFDKDNPAMELTVSDSGLAAIMRVIHNGHNVASIEWLKSSGSFILGISDKDTGVSKATFELKVDGKGYIAGKVIATEDRVKELIHEFRVTVEHNIADHAKPTAAECKEVFKTLPHHDWTKDDDFYIKDSTGGKLVLIKYRATPAATEAAPGNFFYEVLSKAA